PFGFSAFLPPLPVFAEIFQISGRKNCKETIFALEKWDFPPQKSSRAHGTCRWARWKFERVLALSSAPRFFRQSEAFHGIVQNFRDGLKRQIGDDAGTMLCPGQRAPADRNRPGFRFDGQLFLPAACLFPGPANAFPGDVQKGR
ncbi:MAG: hypothetical protein SOW23_02100, partial [Eubacteriales bacterium]|nr:hypothetical protein [Eubacteriales bacterium]